mgnify:CR=1 FL=1
MRSVPEHHCFKVLSEKSQRRIQLYLLKSSPNTATTFFSKMYKISSRNVSPSAGVHWHGSYSNARCTSHFIRTHGKTLRATQSANLNLEMTEILNRQEKNWSVWNSWLEIKIPVDLPSMNFLSYYLLSENVIFVVIY